MIFELLIFVITSTIFYILYTKVYEQKTFFTKRGIPHLKPWPQLKMNVSVVLGKTLLYDVIKENYRMFPNDRYYGDFQFGTPSLIIRDIDLLKQITIKDFDHFTDHVTSFSSDPEDIFNRNLFAIKGEEWHSMRATLSPAFTSSKMRNMFLFMDQCGRNCARFFTQKEQDLIHVNLRDVTTRYTNDVIATTAFGIECDSLNDEGNEFFMMGKRFTEQNVSAIFKFAFIAVMPAIAKLLKVAVIPTDVANFFRKLVRDTIKFREEHHIIRQDMIHLLMEASKGRLRHENQVDSLAGFATAEESQIGKDEKSKRKQLSENDLAAQALVFFLGGYETSASIASFLGWELAGNPEVQRKLQEEVDAVLEENGGSVSYETLFQMKYLDQVISETLRKWSPLFQTDRVCVKDYEIKPVNANEVSYVVRKGETVIIPVAGIHYDPNFYPNPERFDPERFSDENKKNILPGTFLPFGIGPRNCIGSRLALMQVKLLFFHLLSKFDLVYTEKSPLPAKYASVGFSLQPIGGFQMGLKKRKI